MAERSEWPSAVRLRELRQRGQAPYSSRAAAGFVLLCVVATLWASGPGIADLRKTMAAGGAPDLFVIQVFEWGAGVCIRSSIAAVLGWLMIRFIQTRIVWWSGGVSFDLGRLWRWPNGVFDVGGQRLAAGLLALVFSAIVATVLFRFSLREPTALVLQYGGPIRGVAAVFHSLVVAAGILIGVVIVIAAIAEQITFRKKHLQTRAESRQDNS